MECRKAIDESKGDLKKAAKLIQSWGIEKAEKKAGRETGQGLVESYIHATGKVGAIVELQCETDFVARTEDFKKLAHELAMQVASMQPENVEELLKQTYIRDSSLTIHDLVKGVIAKVGENIVIKRFYRLELGE